MRFPYSLAVLLVLAACQPSGEAGEQPAAETAPAAAFDVSSFTGTTYGEALTLTEVTPVSAILADPPSYIGRPVLVQGMVVAVCEQKGCWMDIASDKESEKVQIKVDDGVIVFPLSAKGKHALVEGVVEQLDLTYEQALAEAKRRAEEHGEAFDSTSVTGPQTIFRIRGKGAVVAD